MNSRSLILIAALLALTACNKPKCDIVKDSFSWATYWQPEDSSRVYMSHSMSSLQEARDFCHYLMDNGIPTTVETIQ